MRTSIVRIGNSQGIRIPKVIIEQCHLGTDVELEVENKKLIIRSASHPRQGWEEKFQEMAVLGVTGVRVVYPLRVSRRSHGILKRH